MQEWQDYNPEPAQSGGRRKRRAAAGVAAATAAVLRDPALEEIEKADLRRASSREYAERRWGTTGGSHSGEPRSDSGGSSGAGVWRHPERLGPPASASAAPLVDSQHNNSQHELTQALNSLTHLLSIAVQQGKLGGGNSNSTGNGASGSGAGGGAPSASMIGWGNMEPRQQAPQHPTAVPQLQQLLQQLQQQQQQTQQSFQPPAPQYDYHPGQYGGSAPAGGGGSQIRDAALLGNFGGQRMAPSVAQQRQPQGPPPPLPITASGGGNGNANGSNNNRSNSDLRESLLGRLLAAVAQDRPGAVTEQQLPPQRAEAPPQMDNTVQNTAAALMERAFAARVAQVQAQQQVQGHMQQQQGQGQGMPSGNRASSLQEALAQHAGAHAPKPEQGAGQNRLPTSIPGSTYPVDSLLMQLLQQQAEAQKNSNEAQGRAGQP